MLSTPAFPTLEVEVASPTPNVAAATPVLPTPEIAPAPALPNAPDLSPGKTLHVTRADVDAYIVPLLVRGWYVGRACPAVREGEGVRAGVRASAGVRTGIDVDVGVGVRDGKGKCDGTREEMEGTGRGVEEVLTLEKAFRLKTFDAARRFFDSLAAVAAEEDVRVCLLSFCLSVLYLSLSPSPSPSLSGWMRC